MGLSLQWVLRLACVVTAVTLATGSGAQRGKRWETVVAFCDAMSGPGVENPARASVTSETLRGVTQPAIFEHPSAPGQPLVRLTFTSVRLPRLGARERLALLLSVGIREGFSKADNPAADGCAFIVRVGGEQVLRVEYEQQRWRDARVDLTRFAGRTVSLSFLTDPLKSSNFDWAVWGGPRIVVEGRPARPRLVPRIAFLRKSALEARPLPSRIIGVCESASGTVVTAVLDRGLDLAAMLDDRSSHLPLPPVPLGPCLVVGEGSDPQNHTIVRVLNRQGIAKTQFLAFGLAVRGGVNVNAGDLGSGACIAASPLSDPSVREIRLFDPNGAFVRAITPSKAVRPPYSVAVGRFLDGRISQIAVTSAASGHGAILLYSGGGALVKQLSLGLDESQSSTLVRGDLRAGRDRLLVAIPAQSKVLLVDCATGAVEERSMPDLPSGGAAYVSAHGTGDLLIPTVDSDFSIVERVGPIGDARRVDLGASENRFWIQWYDTSWAGRPDGRYVRKSVFRHIRTDGASPAARNPDLARNAVGCVDGAFMNGLRPLLDGFDRDLSALWEPCFTHRWMKGVFQSWRDVVDSVTKLPRYVMLSRNNRPIEYGEFGSIDFYSGTYAEGLPELDNLYIQPLRAALRALVGKFRSNPEHFVALEPNHEHEIAVDADGSLGDYNPRMIAGFYEFLRALHGDSGLTRRFGIPAGAYFDAPRNWDRGAWDSYSKDNPLFVEWTAYQRYVVNRRVAETYREALAAGFPAEAVKSHQIPDTYAIGKLSAFSTITSRFTPIDWELNAGAGYGFTRYGVWYNQPHDALQDAHGAGFDAVTIGEYQALTPDMADAYNQIRYIEAKGGLSIHCMMWPPGQDKGFNAAMDQAAVRLLSEDRPRTAQTGGVGQIRAVADQYDIACIGTGPAHTGLLKSVGADGKWNGRVYTTPFHAHVAVQALAPKRSEGGVTLGPLNELDSGCQVEITLRASSGSGRALRFAVLRDGEELPGLVQSVGMGKASRRYRFVFRVQLPADRLAFRISGRGARISDLRATVQAEQTPKLSRGVLAGQRHRGAVTFDLLPE